MLSLVMVFFLGFSSIVNAQEAVIQEALEKAKISAETYKSTVLKNTSKAQSLVASNNSIKCPINQTCFRKNTGVFQDSFPGNVTSNTGNTSNTNKILIFVSISMPKTALKSLSIEAKKTRARLIIRGMVNNSMRETGELAKELGYPVDIDPKLFKKFNVRQVPTFVVPVANKGISQWYKLQGNITLSFVFEKAGISEPIKTEIREAKLERETVVMESRQ